THWDREWYLPRAAFLPRLVDATADLLDLLERDAGTRFVLDGQTVLVDDVLAVRPDWATRFAAAVARHQLEVGPWYILADELIPSGESLLQNFLQGARDAAQLGARMNVLYSPDAFGHPAILPTLAHEFGIEDAVVWRGLGELEHGERDLGIWRGPDGARVLRYRLPKQGYEIGADLGDAPQLEQHWAAIRQSLVDRAVTPHVAVFVGADHRASPSDPRTICANLQALEPDHHVRLSTLHQYFTIAHAALDGRRPIGAGVAHRGVAEVSGELRRYDGHTWTLQGVHATRARLKRRHGMAELLLQRKAAALVALAAWHTGTDRHATLRATRRLLLQCQFHDTLCGCCSDLVAREQAARLTSVQCLSHELVRTSLHALARHDPDLARQNPDRVAPTLLLWNPVPRARGGIVTAVLTCFRRDIMVGPPTGRQPRVGPGFRPTMLSSESGELIPVQVLAITPGTERIDAARHYPDQDAVDRVMVAFKAPLIPGLGLRGLATEPGDTPPQAEGLAAHAGRITNRFLEVLTDQDGRVDLVDRRSGERYVDILRLIDEPDQGDSYTPWIDPDAGITRSIEVVQQAILATGPLLGAVETRFTMQSAGVGDISGRLVLIVHADSRVLRVRLEINNGATDHRLRLRIPVGCGDAATAGAAFGFERREPIVAATDAFPQEHPVGTAPAHRYVAAGDGSRGVALLCPGFFEYAWTPHRDLILTIQRSVGELSRDRLPSRPGHAGWPMAIPDAQEPGWHAVDLAVVPLGEHEVGDVAALEQLWEDTFLPLQPTFVRDFVGHASSLATVGGTLEGDGLIFTSLQPAEAGDSVVLRCYNVESAPVRGRWIFRSAVASAQRLRADESVLEHLDVGDEHTVEFTAPARGIVTIKVAPGKG
ncbi:MAG: glycosyl hydrolase-related protein, partial [Gemmatimonadales bacterium]